MEMESLQAQLNRATAKAVSVVAEKERAERELSRSRERRNWEEVEARRCPTPENL